MSCVSYQILIFKKNPIFEIPELKFLGILQYDKNTER